MSKKTELRPVQPLPIPDVVPGDISEHRPDFKWVKPESLRVEGRYQRDLSRRSVKLIKHVVTVWDWGRMKPPICAYNEASELVVIDGQHTAIAAASHPALDEIPVMIVKNSEIKGRASAFIGHNKDRVQVTAPQLYYASLEAGDDVAVALNEACERAGAVIRRNPPPNGNWKVGETVAVGALRKVVELKGKAGGCRVLKILMNARRAPISALEVQTVQALLYWPQWKGEFEDQALSRTIRSLSAEEWQQRAKQTAAPRQSIKESLAVQWFRKVTDS